MGESTPPTVHYVWAGRPICRFVDAPPAGWPDGHRWVASGRYGDPPDLTVSCVECCRLRPERHRWDGLRRATFTCPKCARTSHNPNDARERYCGACHEFFP